MSCSHPLLAVFQGYLEDGKKKVKVLTRIDDVSSVEDAIEKYEHFGDQLMLLPCGSCPGCLKARRKQWAVRCEAEARYHVDNCFVTLTYDDDHVRSRVEDCKMDYQQFIQLLRNNGIKLRYFGCCERGSKTNRLHLHMILFGYIPSDLKASHKSDSGFWCYSSPFLTSIWKKGLVVVSEFCPEAAAYVAGYVDKKLLKTDDSFIFMSTKPGIGRQYIEENLDKLYKYDQIVVNYGSHVLGLPRYFDKVAEQNGVNVQEVRDKRVEKAKTSIYEKFKEFGVKDYAGYFDRILDSELEALKRRKRGL